MVIENLVIKNPCIIPIDGAGKRRYYIKKEVLENVTLSDFVRRGIKIRDNLIRVCPTINYKIICQENNKYQNLFLKDNIEIDFQFELNLIFDGKNYLMLDGKNYCTMITFNVETDIKELD